MFKLVLLTLSLVSLSVSQTSTQAEIDLSGISADKFSEYVNSKATASQKLLLTSLGACGVIFATNKSQCAGTDCCYLTGKLIDDIAKDNIKITGAAYDFGICFTKTSYDNLNSTQLAGTFFVCYTKTVLFAAVSIFTAFMLI